jgi:hypothetical protein
MTHRLLVFGDSWAYGAELDPSQREQLCFGGQLAQLLNVNSVHNCAETGSSVSHLHVQFQTALSRINYDPADHYTAVFFITGQQRFLAFDPDNEFYNLIPAGPSIRPVQHQHRDLIETVNDFYYRNIQSNAADQISLNANLLALQAVCKYHGINDYYISGWQDLHLWPEVDQSRIYPNHCESLFESNLQYIKPNVSHPNAQGHRLIAEKLFEFIKVKSLDSTI